MFLSKAGADLRGVFLGNRLLWVAGVVLVASLTGLYGLWWNDTGGISGQFLSARQMFGVLLMFSLLPPYLFFLIWLQYQRTTEVLGRLEGVVEQRALDEVKHRLHHLSWWAVLLMILGTYFGGLQNGAMVQMMWAGEPFSAFDLAVVTMNCLLWAQIALVMSWRIPGAVALNRLYRTVPVDVYDMEGLRPLARLATMDVLLVAGAMVMMSFQSLDAEFRWGNYVPGTVTGLVSSMVLFSLPMLGLRRAVMQAKAERLSSIDQALAQTDRDDLVAMEQVVAHRERVRDLPNWPIDVRLLTRIVAYVILPPMAWVAAALVENFIDSL